MPDKQTSDHDHVGDWSAVTEILGAVAERMVSR